MYSITEICKVIFYYILKLKSLYTFIKFKKQQLIKELASLDLFVCIMYVLHIVFILFVHIIIFI